MVRHLLNNHQSGLGDHLVVDLNAPTAYTIILNPPGFDRSFLHCPGANDFFYASDIPRSLLNQADLFHFGYPTLMRSIYRLEGAELISILRRAQSCGLTTSLDFSLPDPTTPAGKAPWPDILYYALRYVDLFVPSVEELIFLLDRDLFMEMSQDSAEDFLEAITPERLRNLSDAILALGAKAVLIKLGHRGLYLRTAPASRWKKGGRALQNIDESWFDRTLWAPAFSVDVKGTTGAGDAAIAGFLSSLLRGSDAQTALVMAAAAGACSVSTSDSTSGLMPWEDLLAKIHSGWETLPLIFSSQDWEKDTAYELWKSL
jgi:sugar/nucleoside kinase (ribokinase family)